MTSIDKHRFTLHIVFWAWWIDDKHWQALIHNTQHFGPGESMASIDKHWFTIHSFLGQVNRWQALTSIDSQYTTFWAWWIDDKHLPALIHTTQLFGPGESMTSIDKHWFTLHLAFWDWWIDNHHRFPLSSVNRWPAVTHLHRIFGFIVNLVRLAGLRLSLGAHITHEFQFVRGPHILISLYQIPWVCYS